MGKANIHAVISAVNSELVKILHRIAFYLFILENNNHIYTYILENNNHILYVYNNNNIRI